jgi:acetyltransferase-like isoleucine patch superfamily enzyme
MSGPTPRLTAPALAKLASVGLQMSHHPSYLAVETIYPTITLETPCVIQAQVFFDGPLSVGAFTGIFGGRLRRTHVGRYCSIAPGLQTGWDEHPIDRLTSSMAGYVANVHGWAEQLGAHVDAFRQHGVPFETLRGQTTICNDVWTGLNVFVRSGVTIGDGAIVGAGAYVTKDVPPYTIVGGNPARVIRPRFSEALIERLQRVRWWRFSIYDLPPNLLASPERALDWIEEAEAKGSLRPYRPDTEPLTNLLA